MLFYSLSDMCKGIGDETLYTVYTKSVNGETALRLRPFEEAVKQLSMAGFEGIALASGSGRVVFATVSSTAIFRITVSNCSRRKRRPCAS